jgi:hypothetical protein
MLSAADLSLNMEAAGLSKMLVTAYDMHRATNRKVAGSIPDGDWNFSVI